MFRQAVPSDLDFVSERIQAACGPPAAEVGVRLAPLDADYFAAIARSEVYLSVDPSGALDGLILFHTEPPVMHLDNVAVPLNSHGKGIGSKLIAFCESEARRMGMTSIELYTDQKLLRNIAIYTLLGFVVTSRRLDEGFHHIFFRKLLQAPALRAEVAKLAGWQERGRDPCAGCGLEPITGPRAGNS